MLYTYFVYEYGSPVFPEAIDEAEQQVGVVAHGQPHQKAVEHRVHGAREQHRDGQAVAQQANLVKYTNAKINAQMYGIWHIVRVPYKCTDTLYGSVH